MISPKGCLTQPRPAHQFAAAMGWVWRPADSNWQLGGGTETIMAKEGKKLTSFLYSNCYNHGKTKTHTVYFSIPLTDFISAITMALTFQLLKVFIASGHLLCPGNPRSAIPQWVKPRNCWAQVEPHPWVSPHDWQGRWSPQKFLEFSKEKNFKNHLLSEYLFFQANCHCHRMANLNSQMKLNTQLDIVCLSLNQFFAVKALHAGWRLCNGVHTMRPWYHGSFTLKDCHEIERICIFAAFASLHPKLNHTATTGIQQNGSINGWFFKFRISSSNVAPHGFIFLRPWPRESGFHFTHALVGLIAWQAAHTRQLQGLNGFP